MRIVQSRWRSSAEGVTCPWASSCPWESLAPGVSYPWESPAHGVTYPWPRLGASFPWESPAPGSHLQLGGTRPNTSRRWELQWRQVRTYQGPSVEQSFFKDRSAPNQGPVMACLANGGTLSGRGHAWLKKSWLETPPQTSIIDNFSPYSSIMQA
jgi:hypothetical protein